MVLAEHLGSLEPQFRNTGVKNSLVYIVLADCIQDYFTVNTIYKLLSSSSSSFYCLHEHVRIRTV